MPVGCRLTLNYLVQLLSLVNDEAPLHDSYQSRLAEIGERIDAQPKPSIDQTRMRGFLAVEIMLTRTNPVPPVLSMQPERLKALRWPRSSAGLTYVLKRVRAELDDMTVVNVEEDLGDNRLSAGTWNMLRTARDKRIKSLSLMEKSIEFLRLSLRKRHEDDNLGHIGGRLFDSLESGMGIEAKVQIAEELLEQTEGNIRRAWEPRIQSLK